MGFVLCPITLREANAFTKRHHRHHQPPQGGLFAAGAACVAYDSHERVIPGEVIGVAIVGRPVARHLDDGWTAEVTRLTVLENVPNACSALYAAAWRACRALGYRRLITYTLATEPGTSLRAAGWKCLGEAGGGSWNRAVRPRVALHPTQTKFRWEVTEAV